MPKSAPQPIDVTTEPQQISGRAGTAQAVEARGGLAYVVTSRDVAVEGDRAFVVSNPIADRGARIGLPGATEACFSGEIPSGGTFEACDEIRIFPSCGLGFEVAPILLLLVVFRRRSQRRRQAPWRRWRARGVLG